MPYPRDGEWPQRILDGGDASWAPLAIPFWDILPADELGSVSLPLESLHEMVHVLVEIALLVRRTHAVHPRGCRLAEVTPALVEKRLVEPLIEVAEPMCGVLLGLLRDARPEG